MKNFYENYFDKISKTFSELDLLKLKISDLFLKVKKQTRKL